MRHPIASALPSLLALAAPAPARQATPPEVVIRGGQLFDAEAGRMRPLGQLRIAGGRILGEAPADAPIPAQARTFDAQGCTVLPAFFDLHVHLMAPGGSMTQRAPPDPELNLATHAAFGVLHATDLHNVPELIFELREKAAADPTLARVAAAGAAFTVPGGHCTQFGFEPNLIRTLEDVAPRFEQLIPLRPDVVKTVVEHGGWSTLPVMPTLDEPRLAAICLRAHEAELPVFCHVWTLDEAKLAVRAGVDALVHGVFVGEVDDELIEAMRAGEVGYVPTLSVVVNARRVAQQRSPYAPARIDGLLAPDLVATLNDPAAPSWVAQWEGGKDELFLSNLRRIHAAGIRCGTGTDCGNPLTPHGPALLGEIALYVEAGLAPLQALQCATIESARLLGRERDFGSLAAGKVADVVVVRGDPGADVAALWQIEGVLKAGVAVDREALRARLAAPAAAARQRVLGRDVEPLLDDFDDGDLASAWGGEWVATDDSVVPGGKSAGAIEPAEADGSGVLLVRARLAEGVPFGAYAGATIRWDPGARDTVDLAHATHVVLRARGTPRSWVLALERAAVDDWDVFTAVFTVEESWREIRVALDSFKQVGFGKPVHKSWGDVVGATLTARTNPGARTGFGDFELELDSIRFE